MDEREPFKKRLLNVQTALRAPKGQFNKFGGYSYRSCEDILEAVKPLLAENDLLLTITDEPKVVNVEESDHDLSSSGRVYIKSTVTVCDIYSVEREIAIAYAREPMCKKGMDSAQVSGSSSSYARKYALSGLFLLDDNKDDDTREPSDVEPSQADRPAQAKKKNNSTKSGKQPAEKPAGRFERVTQLKHEAIALGIKEDGIRSWLDATFKGKQMRDFEDREIKMVEAYLAGLIRDAHQLEEERNRNVGE